MTTATEEKREFYLDHNATSPMSQRTMDLVMGTNQQFFGNASSAHFYGQKARAVLDGSRAALSHLVGCNPEELFFTSGGTEANNWIFHSLFWKGGRWEAILISSVEHNSVLLTARLFRVYASESMLGVDSDGVIDLADLGCVVGERDLRDRAFIVSIMLANNETGVIQNLARIADTLRGLSRNVLIHVDAVQAFGKMRICPADLGVDAMTISAHKLGGPKGIGALYLKDRSAHHRLLCGGHQEGDLRAGTENVAGAAGFANAALERYNALDAYRKLTKTRRDLLEAGLNERLDGIHINGEEAERLPNTSNIRFDAIQAEALVFLLSQAGIAVSDGSACEAGQSNGSHVLRAMGQTEEQSKSAIRFSFGDESYHGMSEIEALSSITETVTGAVNSLRGVEPELP